MLSAAITGIGMSKLGRNTGRPCVDLLADAAFEAMADAGLTRDDIDGLTTYPGKHDNSPGMSPLGCTEVREALGLRTRWHSSSAEGPAQMSPVMIAAMAVSTGQARHVLCFRALTESSSQSAGRRASVPTGSGGRVGGWLQWLLPMGAFAAATWAAQFAQRRMHEFGATREMLGAQCVLQRANAQGNPRAVFHGKPMTMDDYLDARMIADPLSMLDCDIPIDGACVVIVSAADAARDCRKPPISIPAMSAALDRDSWDQREDLTQMAALDAGQDLWRRTDFAPADVDVAAVYDGFSVFVPMWLEGLGFCARGEGEAFIAAGHTALNGRLPTNTGGGQLSAGRLHGFGHLHEACVQLWGEGGTRQVAAAQTAVVGMGGGPLAGAMLLHRA
ncbi:thiolase family protein [Novosphingobium tardum]|uniref:Thiolase family protein n=1 Tax=Novosphingobium tardum TaxID=1538021 RepID=A0ABV8RSG6_9SPHN